MKPTTAGRKDGASCRAGDQAACSAASAGLVSGARIITLNGEQPVDDLRVGDHIVTRGGAVPITRIEVLSLIAPVIYVIAGSLGHSRTDRDALVSADQLIHLRDWRAAALTGQPSAFVPAERLVDGEFVRDLGQQLITLHRIHCAAPQVIYAEGLELGMTTALQDDLTPRVA